MPANDDAQVCSECIGEDILKNLVLSEGELGQCTFCGSKAHCLSLEKLADEIHEVIEENFYLTSSEPQGTDYVLAKEGLWERPGAPVDVLIADIAKVSEELAEAIRDCLSEQYGDAAVRDGENDPYGNDALYEEKGIDDRDFRESWDFFKTNIKTRSRFFSQDAEKALDEIFEGLRTHKTISGTPVVRDITPADENHSFYRVRVAFSERELKENLAAPVKELGPPPSRKARAGRMNAAGISVFYGALDPETCVAEARAPVGSFVVLGRFEVIRPLRLLDFDALSELYVEGSYFDPHYLEGRKRAAFLRRLVQDIGRPIMPRDEEFEYLPTQAVAEYLGQRTEPQLDGIVFHSSQTGGEGRNVVLFNHACRVEQYNLPEGTTINFSMGWESEDDFDDSITVFESVPKEKGEATPKEPTDVFPLGTLLDWPGDAELSKEDIDDSADYRDLSLRLDVEGIRVLSIRSVKYEQQERSVSRHRTTDDRPPKF